MGDLKEISVESLLQETNLDKTKLNDLYVVIIDGLDKHGYSKNRDLLEKAKELFSQNRMMFETAHMTREIGISYYKDGNIAKAIRYVEDAVDILQNNTHERDIQETLVIYMTSIGVGYYEVLSYNASIEVFQRCKQFINDKISDNTLYRYYREFTIACIYSEKFEDALELSVNALKYTEGSNIRKAYCYNDLGRCYWKMEKYEDSVEFYMRAIKLFESEHDNNGLAMIYNNLSMLYHTKKDSQKAAEYINKCFELFDKTNPQKCIIYFDTYIRVALKKQDFGEAVDSLLDFIELAHNYSFDKRYILAPIGLIVDKLSKYRNEEYGIKLRRIIIDLINDIEDAKDKKGHYEKCLLSYLGMLKYLFYSKTK